MIQQRNIATSIILTIFTCGIYGIIWFIQLTDDVRNASGDESIPSGGIAFLLTLVTCGIYGFYWAYKLGKALNVAQSRAGFSVTADNSVLYLILQIFGLGIVNYALMQNQLNMIAGGNNNGQSNPQQPNTPNANTGSSTTPQQPAAPAAPAQPTAIVTEEDITVVEEQ